MLRVF
jgi:hypothetical protein